jgi:hypothetical protein
VLVNRPIPSLDELCTRYGDPTNRKVYMMSRDVEGRWMDLYGSVSCNGHSHGAAASEGPWTPGGIPKPAKSFHRRQLQRRVDRRGGALSPCGRARHRIEFE